MPDSGNIKTNNTFLRTLVSSERGNIFRQGSPSAALPVSCLRKSLFMDPILLATSRRSFRILLKTTSQV